MVGAETAAHLANHGNEVTIVEQLPAIAKDIEVVSRIFLMEDLMKHNVKILTNSRDLEIMDNEVIISTNDVEQIEGPVDTIVIAVGAKPDNNLTNSWKGVNQVIPVGAAVKVRKAIEAIEEGYRAGLTVESQSVVLV